MNQTSKILLFLCLLCVANRLISQDPTVGLIHSDSNAYDGYLLFSPMTYTSTYLVDNCGEKLKEWTFDDLPGLYAKLLPDGTLMRAQRTEASFGGGGSGGRIVHKTWNDELIWYYDYSNDRVKQHHDFAYLPNGNVLILAWERKSKEDAIELGRNPQFIDDGGVWFEHIVEIKPIGKDEGLVVWEWHMLDHLIQDFDATKENFGIVSEHPEKMNINYKNQNEFNSNQPGHPDWMHMNSLDYNEYLDQILLSSRNMYEVYIIDHSTTSEESASSSGGKYGKGGDFLFRWGNNAAYNMGTESDQLLFSQHHASWVRDGQSDNNRITIFNNGLNRPEGLISSIEIVSLDKADGFYQLGNNGSFIVTDQKTIFATEAFEFTSPRLSGAQILENGNILIASGNIGEIFEISPDQELVWKYINPVASEGPLSQGDSATRTDIFRAEKLSSKFVGFEGKMLERQGRIELNPIQEECLSTDSITFSSNGLIDANVVFAYPNPANDRIYLQKNVDQKILCTLRDLNGRVLKSINLENDNSINIENIEQGIYILTFVNDRQRKTIKILKE